MLNASVFGGLKQRFFCNFMSLLLMCSSPSLFSRSLKLTTTLSSRPFVTSSFILAQIPVGHVNHPSSVVGKKQNRLNSQASSNEFTTTPSNEDAGLTTSSNGELPFKVLKEHVAYSRWRQLIERDVEMPSGTRCSFDVISQDDSIVVFVWNSSSRSATLIREAHPGPMELFMGVVAGMYEKQKHSSPLEAAKFELEEEAHLTGGTWINLLKDEETSIPVDKYSTNRFHCYLVLDPEETDNPRELDAEEYITIEKGYTKSQIMDLIAGGKMNIMSSYTCLLAFEKLRVLGYL